MGSTFIYKMTMNVKFILQNDNELISCQILTFNFSLQYCPGEPRWLMFKLDSNINLWYPAQEYSLSCMLTKFPCNQTWWCIFLFKLMKLKQRCWKIVMTTCVRVLSRFGFDLAYFSNQRWPMLYLVQDIIELNILLKFKSNQIYDL